ncbi:hypothetical protein K8R47_02455 [archaeon]|nr:hypothetical protein [archaeon]
MSFQKVYERNPNHGRSRSSLASKLIFPTIASVISLGAVLGGLYFGIIKPTDEFKNKLDNAQTHEIPFRGTSYWNSYSKENIEGHQFKWDLYQKFVNDLNGFEGGIIPGNTRRITLPDLDEDGYVVGNDGAKYSSDPIQG